MAASGGVGGGTGGSPFELRHAGGELLDVAPHVGQFAEGRELQLPVAEIDGRLAQHDLAGFDVVGDA